MMLVPGGRSLDQAFSAPIDEAGAARAPQGRHRDRRGAAVHPRARARPRRHQAVEHPRLGRRPRVPDRLRLREAPRRAHTPQSGRRPRERVPRARGARRRAQTPTTAPTSTRSERRSTRCSAGAPPRKESPIRARAPERAGSAGERVHIIHRCLEEDAGARFPDAAPARGRARPRSIANFTTPAPGRTLGPFRILVRDRPRRHGRRLPRRPGSARARGRAQGAAARVQREPVAREALPARGRGGLEARPPAHHPDLRVREVRRLPLLRDEARPRRHAREDASTR